MDHDQHTNLTLGSPAFANNSPIPATYTCRGENTSPPLTVTNIPAGTQSLVLVMHDPDAVSQDFTHWLLWNIPPTTSQISTNSTPSGAIIGTNGSGKTGYMGPCPPAGTGTHRYMFELYALDKTMNLPETTGRPVLEQSLEGHVLAHFTLTGLFSAEPS